MENVLICALARDCAKSLENNIPRVNKLLKSIKGAEVYIIENDSKDKTKEILEKWSLRDKRVKVKSFNSNTLTIPDKQDGEVDPRFSRFRIEKMANYRNMYIDYFMKNSRFEYLLVLDIDIGWFSINGFTRAVRKAPKDWGGIFANGTVLDDSFNPIYCDSYAYVEDVEFLPVFTFERIFGKRKEILATMLTQSFTKVISAFGGMAIYKRNAISGLRYNVIENNDKNVQVLCEHIPFNLEIVKRGYSNYISRDFALEYFHVSLVFYAKRFFRKFF